MSQIEPLRAAILARILPHVPFSGWTEESLRLAAEEATEEATEEAGASEISLARAFPGGVAECVEYFSSQADRAMERALAGYHLGSMKIREKVGLAVRLRLEGNSAEREAVRRAVRFFALPHHTGRGLQSLYRTVDAVWYAIGDRSTDFNFYTKRLLLHPAFLAEGRIARPGRHLGLPRPPY